MVYNVMRTSRWDKDAVADLFCEWSMGLCLGNHQNFSTFRREKKGSNFGKSLSNVLDRRVNGE